MSIGYAAAFLGGVATLLSPCAAMLLPGFFAMAFGARKVLLLGRIGLFFVGTLLTLVPLGMAAGTAGALLVAQRALIATGGGAMLVVIGALTILGVSIRVPGLRARGGTSAAAVVALGAVYGLAGACTGPLLGAVLTFVAVSGSTFYGAMLLALFGAGMAAPLAVLAFAWDVGGVARWLRPRRIIFGPIRTTAWGIIAGLLFVALGMLFLFSDATGALGGLLDASQQLRLESALWRWASGIPDVVALLALVLLGGAMAWWAVAGRARLAESVSAEPSSPDDVQDSPQSE